MYILKSGVITNDYLLSAIKELADKLPFDIVITSAFRDPRSQARAMLNNMQYYDGKASRGETSVNPKIPYITNYLVDLYADKTLAWGVHNSYPQSPSPWTETNLIEATQVVQDYYDRGGGKHNKYLAFDVSFAHNIGTPRDWISTDINLIISTAESLNYTVDNEGNHLHIEIPAGPEEKKNQLALFFLLGIAIWIYKKS